MAFKMKGYSAFTKKTNEDPLTIGKEGKYTTYDTTYYGKDGKKITGVTEEDTGKIQKEGNRRFVMHEDGRKLYIDK